MFRKRNLIIGAIILVAVGVFFYLRRDTEEELRTETVRRGTVVETVSVTGRLVPVTYADLSFASVGTIERVYAEEGSTVAAGQVIASLDPAVLHSNLRAARLALEKAEASERLARRNWDDLKPEERRTHTIATDQAREAVRAIQAELGRTHLVAPFAGTLTLFDARPGEVAAAGAVLARVVGSPDLWLEARIPESDVAKVAQGMKAQVDFDALAAGELAWGEVTAIDQAATVIQDVVSYTATLRLADLDPRLKEGMTADVDIETARSDNVLVVPFRVLTREDNKTYAERVRADGSLERVEVVVGVEGDDGTTEIRSGLREGDRVTLGTPQTN